MIVVTAGTFDYRRIIEAQERKCAEYGYDHRVFDLGGLGIGKPFDVPPSDLEPQHWGHSLPAATFKVRLLIANFEEGKTICWIDGDCLPLLPFTPDGEWDAAVTLRPLREIGLSGHRSMDFLNAGVVWVRSAAFLNEWQSRAVRLNTDQDGLNEVVAAGYSKAQWRDAMGRTITSPDGFRVKILDASDWNRWNLPPKADTRILHFKRRLRDQARKYC